VAEIRVERKQRSVWPWLLGLVLLVLLAMGLMAMLGDDREPVENNTTEVGAMRQEQPASPVPAYPTADLGETDITLVVEAAA
jgi:hypothetical protein